MSETSFEKKLELGEVLFREGDVGNEMYLIKKGRIKISKVVGNLEKTLVLLQEGDFFGEMALIDGSPRSADATALEETVLVVFDRQRFQTRLENDPLIKHILGTVSQRLRDTNKQIEMLLIKDDMARVVAMLLAQILKGTVAVGENRKPGHGLTPSELSDLVGLPVERTRIHIDRLCNSGLLSITDDLITVLNPEELEEYSIYISLKEKFRELS